MSVLQCPGSTAAMEMAVDGAGGWLPAAAAPTGLLAACCNDEEMLGRSALPSRDSSWTARLRAACEVAGGGGLREGGGLGMEEFVERFSM